MSSSPVVHATSGLSGAGPSTKQVREPGVPKVGRRSHKLGSAGLPIFPVKTHKQCRLR